MIDFLPGSTGTRCYYPRVELRWRAITGTLIGTDCIIALDFKTKRVHVMDSLNGKLKRHVWLLLSLLKDATERHSVECSLDKLRVGYDSYSLLEFDKVKQTITVSLHGRETLAAEETVRGGWRISLKILILEHYPGYGEVGHRESLLGLPRCRSYLFGT